MRFEFYTDKIRLFPLRRCLVEPLHTAEALDVYGLLAYSACAPIPRHAPGSIARKHRHEYGMITDCTIANKKGRGTDHRLTFPWLEAMVKKNHFQVCFQEPRHISSGTNRFTNTGTPSCIHQILPQPKVSETQTSGDEIQHERLMRSRHRLIHLNSIPRLAAAFRWTVH